MPFLAFQTLYKNKIIAPKNDVFIYIEQDEAFLTLYKEGKYLSAKSLSSLKEMQQELQKQDIELSLEAFELLLQEKGLAVGLYTKDDAHIFNALEAEFSKMFTKINNVITHNRSVFGFDVIERLFMSTHFGRIRGLKEFIINFFSNGTMKVLDFQLFSNQPDTSPLSPILASYMLDQASEQDPALKIDFFKRKDPFLQTEAGKFVLIVCGFLALLLAYPIYLSIQINALEQTSLEVASQRDSIKASTNKLQTALSEQKKALSQIQNESSATQERIKKISKSITDLYATKTASKTTSDFFYRVNLLLQKYKLQAKNIKLEGAKNMHIAVYSNSKDRDNIAKFMQDLIAQGFVGVNTQEIKLEDNTYISLVELMR
ncbi:MAG: hypothetical protein IBX44_07090 [Sulfurospirillum sp.]|nr:hypothetical protein [Sulfurospirillum sp.]